ncbi:DUF4194 domain-containing protein [Heliophilum fasciatum]|uniref:Uncharacterized protein DUF4194 n=1 Tax=Heliophilum fasciatum TaxID=35700 RepID=A0A4V2SY33_9FIRM|nr:DUF4194 domain-containing protein [Heliophilum fasciatum]MCW2276948.1 hypothetical protein [Heliophilum fasciatum]TCP68526.1 uncharacterized protein DUF4194 [Heliophilum fasciatum]
MSHSDTVAFSRALVALCKNVVYKETEPRHWEVILSQRHKLEDYVSKLGLTLIVDEMDGYGFLKQRSYGSDEEEIPRLIPRHPLSYPVSLLLVLLRKRLVEFDSAHGDQRLVVKKEEIVEQMRLFLRDTTNEAKLVQEIEKLIERVERMGFLRHLKGGNDGVYEVQRILRSAADAQWLSNFKDRLEEYKRYAEGGAATPEGDD